MSKKASPTVIGAFVVTAFALAIGLIVVFTGGRFFRDTANVITYFDGSVTGLRVGAAVRFRGIDIGAVKDIRINMTGVLQDPTRVRIPVTLQIDNDRLKSNGVREVDVRNHAQLQELVEHGLRTALATESLVTGVRYVSLDIRPNTPIVLENDPKVPYPEIPSVRDPFQEAPEQVSKFLANLSQIDVTSLLHSVQETFADAHRVIGSPHVTSALAGIDELAKNLNETARSLGKTTQELEQTANEWKQTASSAHQLIAPEGALSAQLDATLSELGYAARSLRRLADHLDRDPGALVRGGRP